MEDETKIYRKTPPSYRITALLLTIGYCIAYVWLSFHMNAQKLAGFGGMSIMETQSAPNIRWLNEHITPFINSFSVKDNTSMMYTALAINFKGIMYAGIFAFMLYVLIQIGYIFLYQKIAKQTVPRKVRAVRDIAALEIFLAAAFWMFAIAGYEIKFV